MSSRDKGLTKAEKRWQRQLREREVERQRLAARPAAKDGGDPEEYETTQRFRSKLEAEGRAKASHFDFGLAKRRYGVKLSAALLDVCEPLLDTAEGNPDRISKCVALGIIGWNMACVPDAPIDDLLSELQVPGANRELAREVVARLYATVEGIKARKLELYPNFNMIIMEHEVVFRDGNFQVNVAGAEIPAKATSPRKGLLGRMRGLIRR